MLTQLILTGIIPILYLLEWRIRNRSTSVITNGGKNPNTDLPLGIYECIIALVVSFALSISFAYFTGILKSGFHLVDDHETLGILKNIDSYGLAEALKIRLSADLYGRFRPTYCVIRVLQTYFFRSDYYAWHMMYAMITAFILYMGYIYARIRGVYIWMAYVEAVAVYIGGGQSAVMWRLGPQEGLGLLIFMITVMCLRWYRRKRSVFSFIVLTVLTILLGGAKEAFLVLIPCLPAMLTVWDIEERESDTAMSVRRALYHNMGYICVTIAVCLTDVLFIVFGINTDYIDNQYLGEAAASFGLYDYIRGIGASVLRGFLPYFIIFIAANVIFIIQLCKSYRDSGRFHLLTHLFMFLTVDVMVAIQIVMYSKYHMRERYIIPSSLLVSALWYVGAFRLLREEHSAGIYRIYKVLSVVFAGMLLLIKYDNSSNQYLYPGETDQDMALSYAADGSNITAALNYLGDMADGREVCISMYGEHAASASMYLNHFYDMGDNILISDPDETVYSDDILYLGYTEDMMSMTDDRGMAIDTSRIHQYGDYTVIAR